MWESWEFIKYSPYFSPLTLSHANEIASIDELFSKHDHNGNKIGPSPKNSFTGDTVRTIAQPLCFLPWASAGQQRF
jgi:hypothetical protein